MSKVLIEEQTLYDIADAVRRNISDAGPLKPSEIAGKILAIPHNVNNIASDASILDPTNNVILCDAELLLPLNIAIGSDIPNLSMYHDQASLMNGFDYGSLLKDSGNTIIFDLGSAKSFTAYVVVDASSSANAASFSYILGCGSNLNSRSAPGFANYNTRYNATLYQADYDTGVSIVGWHVLALAINVDSKTAKFFIDSQLVHSYDNLLNSGRYVTLNGLCDNTHTIQRQAGGQYKYFAVTDGTDTDDNIIANSNAIRAAFSDLFDASDD